MAHCLSRSLATILLAIFALPRARAAELGDARVSSYIGQQLVADIELTTIEHPGTPVQVRLAHPDVYRGANIALPAVLSSLNMSVMQRDGRQFLHVTSIKPVDADHLHLYVELVDGGQRTVRLSTLWLTADPNPNPAPAVAAAPEPARPPLAWEKAPGAEPVPRVAHALVPLPEAKPTLAQRIRLPLPVAPAHLPVAMKPAPAACTPKPSEDAKACVALDAKNAELRAQITKLEQKVQVLQVSMQGKPAAAAVPAKSVAPAPKQSPAQAPAQLPASSPAQAPASAAAQSPVAPAVKPAAKPTGPAPILPRKARKHVEPEEQGLPWLAIGAGAAALLALAGGGVWFVRRRRAKAQWPEPSAAVSREGIKSRLMGGP